MQPAAKLLIIRLSSFGDILQCLPSAAAFRHQCQQQNSKCEIHWVVRKDFSEILQHHPALDQLWSFDPKLGFIGWIKLCHRLRQEGFTHVYDAHNNMRSHILTSILLSSRTLLLTKRFYFLRRSKERVKRFLLFFLRINFFAKPYRGLFSYLTPLEKWLGPMALPAVPVLHFSSATEQKVRALLQNSKPFIAIAPSAAWEMKRWPVVHWQRLLQLMPEHQFVVLGGPDDRFCQELEAEAPQRIFNWAGRLSLIESCAALTLADLVISADTGLLHAADLLGCPTIALIGPTAFGYPSYPSSKVLQSNLPCQPCSKDGRGRCKQAVFQRCMIEITPEKVAAAAREMLQ